MSRTDYLNDPNAPEANRIIPATSAIIVATNNKILLHRRTDNDLWGLPGGTMEVGESIKDCLVREVREETGLNVEPIHLIGIYSNPKHIIVYSDGEVRQEFSVCFACKIIDGKLHLSEESSGLAFFSIEEIEHLEIHPSIRERIEDYKFQTTEAILK